MSYKLVKLLKQTTLAIIMLFVSFNSSAETIWTKQLGTYNWYKATTYSLSGTPTVVSKYIITNPVNFIVPVSWVKQPGIYMQCKSTGGATKYVEESYDCYGKLLVTIPNPTEVTECAGLLCKTPYGIVFRADLNTVVKCPRVFINANKAVSVYDGVQNIDGIISCN